jgi:hypothetical protein
VRLVDRLRATSAETVYLVYDPRHDRKAVLRHLGESESADAIRPDEFRQRFAAMSAVTHPNLLATLEVLEIGGRPAALQEWLRGLPSSDWPTFAAVAGVWYRLMTQAVLALHTAHQAGLVHGRLEASILVLTTEGVLKLCGVGEPAWLTDATDDEATAVGDLTALGRIASVWATSTESSSGKKSKVKPLPEVLQRILHRLLSDDADMKYADTSELLRELDQVGEDVPANAAAWERLVRHVREQVNEAGLRLSA